MDVDGLHFLNYNTIQAHSGRGSWSGQSVYV
jgi:hypothetical protein